VLEPLGDEALARVLGRALADEERGLGGRFALADGARAALLEIAGGDARRLLNALESAAELATAEGTDVVTPAHVVEAAQTRFVAYDASGDDRYDLLSAFHKSLRGSDVDASLFWMARMLEAGEDPLVVVRRMIACASEDVGLADPLALRLALDAWEAVSYLGRPEGELAMAHACIYLASAPKSNTVVKALNAAREAARAHPDLPVPIHIRNAPTSLARSLGHGKAYRYPHDYPNAFVDQTYLPPEMEGLDLVAPRETGAEREVVKRLAWWRRLRSRATGREDGAEG